MARDALLELLGAKCRACGTKEKLEFDCVKPMGDEHHHLEWSHRISWYRQQAAAGNLQVLCRSCNASKKNRDNMQLALKSPFVEWPF